MARGRQVQYPLQPPGGLLPWLTPTQRWPPPLGIVGRKGLSVPPAPSTVPAHSHPVPHPWAYPSSSLDNEKEKRGEGGVKGKDSPGPWRSWGGGGSLGGGLRPELGVHRDPREYGVVRQSPLGAPWPSCEPREGPGDLWTTLPRT